MPKTRAKRSRFPANSMKLNIFRCISSFLRSESSS
jgi:hypothetical protein